MSEQIISLSRDGLKFYLDWYVNKNNTVEIEVRRVEGDLHGGIQIFVDGKKVYEASEHKSRQAPERGWQDHRCGVCGTWK